jgi:hypothetical protein
MIVLVPTMPVSYHEVYRKMSDYRDGRCSARYVVDFVNAHRGEASHMLWEDGPQGDLYADHCFENLSEERMFELLQALINDNPNFTLLLEDEEYGSFYHVALKHNRWGARAASTRVLLLLCSPGMTRVRGDCRFGPFDCAFPLHYACSVEGLHPDVINRLIDLDPDVLMLPAGDWILPIHCILSRQNPPIPVVRRMVELRPASLLHSDGWGRTPFLNGLARANPSPEMAHLLELLATQSPESVRAAQRDANTAVFRACLRFHLHPRLIRAVVGVDPTALCVAFSEGYLTHQWNSGRHLLPFEVCRANGAAGPVVAFLEEESLHMALAAAELAMGGAGFPNPTDALESFRRLVRDTAARFLLAAPLVQDGRHGRPPSALEVVRTIRALGSRMDFCLALFCHVETVRNLIKVGDDGFCNAILGDAVLGLYRLNHHDRSNPSASYQVRLLALVSDNLDCIYLQFREHAGHLL